MKKVLVFALALMLFAVPAMAAPAVSLSWSDNSTNETGFNMDRKPGACAAGGTWTPIGNIAADGTSFVDVSVASGATYCYRVYAANAAGWSAFSPTFEITVPVQTPAAPSNLTGVVIGQ